MFKKILIANRGEIALRIIRACKEMGIRTVAVHSEEDRESLHVEVADESVCIGPAQSSESYLNIPNIISAAEITGADAIHPGYGFLSENSYFAEVCESCNIKFIGPSKEAILKMGDKVQARAIMDKAGVPIIPGSEGVISTVEEALKLIKKVKYPVIVKAAGGGGGKGMRIVQNEEALKNAILTAQNEAKRAFGNPEVYIEKYVEEPRHIEFQIMADVKGDVVYLPERDCSIQRRYQKLLEESPSTFVSEKLRKKMGKAACRAAKAVKYVTVGTVEFLVDKQSHYYFMEMNTRIQVEHPVSELVTGIDLVKEQIRLAAGECLAIDQSDIEIKGQAIECRINAEDSEKDFIPSPGKITRFLVPGGPGVRVDTHIYTGYTITPYYDSMVAKILTYGHDRNEATIRMQRALSEFVIEGVKTTIPFHLRILDNQHFKKGEVYTNFIQKRIIEEVAKQ
ncbi:MAG: acetyl-CoA carboxylase biotin carboxylase subunit [Elusimicrobia bacterium]|nr:acetyl-CoA carboxylase biotin carboxylase subunit [Elusimicrobiota bacterium]